MVSVGWREADWWKSKVTIGGACAGLFDLYVVREAEVFSSSMAFLKSCLDQSEELVAPVSSPSLRVALAILGQSYQYMLSLWLDLSEGRLASAAAHWRSLAEAPDFMLAASLNEDFAREWADPNRRGTVKPERARRIIRRELNRRQGGEGDRWDQKRQQDLTALQPYSHVSSEAAGLAILKPNGAQGGHFITAEGRYGPDVKEGALYTAHLCRQLLGAAAVAFASVLPDDMRREASEIFDQTKLQLQQPRATAES
jgi:hypothetical protein